MTFQFFLGLGSINPLYTANNQGFGLLNESHPSPSPEQPVGGSQALAAKAARPSAMQPDGPSLVTVAMGSIPKYAKKHQSNQICLYKEIYEICGKQDLWPRFLEFRSFSKMLCPFLGVRTNL